MTHRIRATNLNDDRMIEDVRQLFERYRRVAAEREKRFAQRKRRRPATALVDEVQPEAVERRVELREALDRDLLRPPVEAACRQPGRACALLPARPVQVGRPASTVQALSQVVDDGLSDVASERLTVIGRSIDSAFGDCVTTSPASSASWASASTR
jgi:hypothetical protein